MNWEAMGAFAEVVAAMGVIITLIYVATQIRQNTNQLQGDAIIAINNTEEALVEDLRDDEELTRIFVIAASDWESLSAQEQARAHLYLHAYTRWYETCWLLWSRGALDDITYSSREAMAILMLSPKGSRLWWEGVKSVFDPRFVALIKEKLDELGPDAPSIVEAVPFYQPHHWKKENEA